MTDLKPCPFCGSKAEADCYLDDPADWQVNCTNENCFLSRPLEDGEIRFLNQATAEHEWNQRAEQGTDESLDSRRLDWLEAGKGDLIKDGDYWHCDTANGRDFRAGKTAREAIDAAMRAGE